jgi:hypothetical protein
MASFARIRVEIMGEFVISRVESGASVPIPRRSLSTSLCLESLSYTTDPAPSPARRLTHRPRSRRIHAASTRHSQGRV